MKRDSLMRLFAAMLLAAAAAGCQTPKREYRIVPVPMDQPAPEAKSIEVSPKAIAGTPRATNNEPTGGYAPSNVQAQLNIDVRDGVKEVKVVRDNADPYVITKPYRLKNADPYAVRSYLAAAVGAKTVNDSPAQVTAVKFSDGRGVVLVSAEEYRFKDTDECRGIDSIVASLDRKGLSYFGEAGAHIYFPRHSRASNLREMLLNTGSGELDPQFAISPSTLVVDGELNALVVKAPEWRWAELYGMLRKYDIPTPEIKITYQVLEIYAENDDRIGVDFQSWKNNEGVDLFSAGTIVRRNWGSFFVSGVQNTGNNRTSWWNLNPKWNTRYLDFMTNIGMAKCLARGTIVAQNRKTSMLQVNSGFFYDRTNYTENASSIDEACEEFAYADPNPNAIPRQSLGKILPQGKLQELLNDGLAGSGYSSYLAQAGYVRRAMGTQTGEALYYDAIAKAAGDSAISPLSKYLVGFVSADGTVTDAAWFNGNWRTVDSAPGVIHGWIQYPMVVDGFQFNLQVTPVVTGKAATILFDLTGSSLLGWNGDGSARRSESRTSTTVQIGYGGQDFFIGGLRKSEAVRGNNGLPYLKDLPVIGRILSTETESIKQSQLILVAHVEYSKPDAEVPSQIQDNLGKIVKGINRGMTSRTGNMFFDQYWLDEDRADRADRLDDVDREISNDYQTLQ
ncbi:MAG: hypothetical protein MJ025_04840 [Victivallaceae bacterium]|nr:hypothetical protein [Victivallaceae bacterium]